MWLPRKLFCEQSMSSGSALENWTDHRIISLLINSRLPNLHYSCSFSHTNMVFHRETTLVEVHMIHTQNPPKHPPDHSLLLHITNVAQPFLTFPLSSSWSQASLTGFLIPSPRELLQSILFSPPVQLKTTKENASSIRKFYSKKKLKRIK